MLGYPGPPALEAKSLPAELWWQLIISANVVEILLHTKVQIQMLYYLIYAKLVSV